MKLPLYSIDLFSSVVKVQNQCSQRLKNCITLPEQKCCELEKAERILFGLIWASCELLNQIPQ